MSVSEHIMSKVHAVDAARKSNPSATVKQLCAANDISESAYYDNTTMRAGRHSIPDEEVTLTPSQRVDFVSSLARHTDADENEQRDLLLAATASIRNSEAWRETLEIQGQLARNGNVKGWQNSALLAHHVQRISGDGLTASKSAWKRLGRNIHDDAQGCTIWVPRARKVEDENDGDDDEPTKRKVRFIYGGKGLHAKHYDITETDGPAVTPNVRRDLQTSICGPTPAGDDAFLDAMLDVAADAGIEVQFTSAEERDFSSESLSFDHREDAFAGFIDVPAERSTAAQAATIAHELAHRFDEPLAKSYGTSMKAGRKYYRSQRPKCNFIAESVAHAVAAHYGVNMSDSTAHYIDAWSPNRDREAKNCFKRAQRALLAIIGKANELHDAPVAVA